MLHPIERLEPAARARAFVLLLASTLVVLVAVVVLGEPLRTDAAPHGIVSYELCVDGDRARAMLASWGERGRLLAAFTLGLDYVFLLAYGGAVAAACVVASPAAWAGAGRAFAWAVTLAAALDAVENAALLAFLLAPASTSALLSVAAIAAGIKFALVLAALIYVAVAFTARRTRRRR